MKAKTKKATKTPVPALSASANDSGKAVIAAKDSDSAKAAAAPVLRDSLKAMPLDSGKTGAARADTAKTALSDSAKAASKASAAATAAAVAAATDSSGEGDSTKTKAKKRRRVVRETTVNTIDELKGKYRSPKKALFMSLVVPGLGQAYVGHTWTNYARGATYFLADVAMIYGWHHYVVDRQNAEIRKYRLFADSNWSQWKYEDSLSTYPDKVALRNQHRQSYCDAVQDRSTVSGNNLYLTCLEPKEGNSFQQEYNDQNWSVDSISHRRAQFPNSQAFYEVIGKEEEFITGWKDANSVLMGDSAFYQTKDGSAAKDAQGQLLLATTPDQQAYVNMRATANNYARMQAYFLGGMVINHIVSAIDAALTAHYHNLSLYQTETSWYDHIRLDSQLAWDGYAPTPTVTASVTF